MFDEYLAQARIDEFHREAARESLARLAKQPHQQDGRQPRLAEAAYYLRKAMEGYRQ